MLDASLKCLSGVFVGKGSCVFFVGKSLVGWVVCLASACNTEEAISRSIPWAIAFAGSFLWYGGAWLLKRSSLPDRYKWLAVVLAKTETQAASA